MGIPFTKLHGHGNDFIVIDARDTPPPPALINSASIVTLCQRAHGVGADGVILALPPKDEAAVARMRIFNADGSEAEMCGNGIRCLAKVLYDGGIRGHDAPSLLPIETLAGLLPCEIHTDDSDRAHTIRVAMGPARLAPQDLPMTMPGPDHVDAPLPLRHGDPLVGTAVSLGNPHYVSFVDLLAPPEGREDLTALATRLGPHVEHHEAFPRRTNLEVARVRDDGSIDLVVWERGCGITQACGTGACATAAAAVLTGRLSAHREIDVDLPGGRLQITVAPDLKQIWMRGPAIEVYRGELPTPKA